jgi:flagellum-specific peptidoglycan hydrolase FlgJ
MPSANKPLWQQVTALVSLSAGGAITGFHFAPRAQADIKSPSNIPIRLMALKQSAQPSPADDSTLRSAIVNVANYYLRMAADKTPADMEAIIWQHDSIDGVDHGASCAAFASLTLELAAQVVGQQSWVTGGTSYPWPLHKWADVRVDPNPASLGITSVLQDAQEHHRWHPQGDGYDPLPGDWVLFDGHVEVITKYAGGVLHTVGGDSLPNFSVNAHDYRDPLGAQGVVGFVNNGELAGTASKSAGSHEQASAAPQARDHADQRRRTIPGTPAAVAPKRTLARSTGGAAIPGLPEPAASPSKDKHPARHHAEQGPKPASHVSESPGQARPGNTGEASVPGTLGADTAATSQPGTVGTGPAASQPGTSDAGPAGTSQPGTVGGAPAATAQPGTVGAGPAATAQPAAPGAAAIPGLPVAADRPNAGSPAPSATAHGGHHSSPPAPPTSGSTAQQAFINEVAPGAVAAQRLYGVPASVTIAQAIEESGWGQSSLATQDHNLFGIKGTGPAGTDPRPTQEYENGQPLTRTALFRVYHNVAESLDDHGKLLATSGYYRHAMAVRHDPSAFAAALTGVYATDPDYGAKLIGLMQRYDLYRYDSAAPAATSHAATPSTTTPSGTSPGAVTPSGGTPSQATPNAPTPSAAPPSSAAPSTASPSGAPPSGATPSASPPSGAAPSAPTPSAPPPSSAGPGGASIPGLLRAVHVPAAAPSPAGSSPRATPGPALQNEAHQRVSGTVPSIQTMSVTRMPTSFSYQTRQTAPRNGRQSPSRYQQRMPPSVSNAFATMARVRLMRAEPLYRDVASYSGISWELLAAVDWMQCQAQARYSPVHGEKLGTVNPDSTMYRTKSEALEQCADDLVKLAGAVYRIDLTTRENLSVRDLANVFAAFRWGGLLKLHHTSAMEFPYSVAGLTDQHTNMRWPNIDEPNTPDKPGRRFRMPFGAVPVVLGLNYPATV